MNISLTIEFKEAILLADYVINMALVELSELDQQSIKSLQSIPEYQKDTTQLLKEMESANQLLDQAGKIAKRLMNVSSEVAR
jgi:hypothetical protein